MKIVNTAFNQATISDEPIKHPDCRDQNMSDFKQVFVQMKNSARAKQETSNSPYYKLKMS